MENYIYVLNKTVKNCTAALNGTVWKKQHLHRYNQLCSGAKPQLNALRADRNYCNSAQTHTHTHTYIYVYTYIYVCTYIYEYKNKIKRKTATDLI